METRWRFRDQPITAKGAGRGPRGSAPRWSWASRKGDGTASTEESSADHREKCHWSDRVSVPETDTGRRGEEPQARE